jgi:hypothetical protein
LQLKKELQLVTEAFSEVMLERIFPVRKIFLLGKWKESKEN